MKLSIVVIIYNVGIYLRECISSIINQTYSSFELILVDDGSSDGCNQICDEFATADDRIKVLHQRNQGPVKARWNGIVAATGDYIVILDGDDWCEDYMLEHMVSLVEQNNADIAILGYKEDYGTHFYHKKNLIESGCYSGNTLPDLFAKALYSGRFYDPGIIPSCWNKIIRRRLFFDRFNHVNGMIRMGDDAALTYPAISLAKVVVIDNESSPYHYRIRTGSMSRSYDMHYFERAEKLISSLSCELSDNVLMREDLPYYALFILNIGINNLLSRSVHIPLLSKLRTIKDATERIKAVIDMGEIDWNGFTANDREQFKRLLKGNIECFAIDHYFRRAVQRLENLFHLR